MDGLSLVGVGASAGGVEALTALARALPDDLPAAVLVVLHVPPDGRSALPQILDRVGSLPALAAVDGDVLRPGHIYVAPPDCHLLAEGGLIRLSRGPREHGHRPAVDPMLRSLAGHGGRATGVILSGTRGDGAQGLARIKAAGGTALVQDPEEAAYDGMILSALAQVEVDAVLPVARLAGHLAKMSSNSSSEFPAEEENAPEMESTTYTCPECGGHLSQENGEVLRYVCKVGHAYSADSLDEEQAVAVERALWTATRLLEDRSLLLDELAGRARHERTAAGFRHGAEEALRASQAVRSLLIEGRVPSAAGSG